MKASNLIRVAMRSITRNKMRSLLTMLGIIIGVSAVIVMIAIGSGAQSKIQEQIGNLGTNMIVITPGSTNQGGASGGAGSFNRLTVDDALNLKREATLLSGVSPVIITHTVAISPVTNWRTFIFGVDTDYQTIRDWPTSEGVFFDQNDVRAMRKVAVLGKTAADNLFPGENPVGQQLRVRGVPVTVIGVLAEKGQTASGNDQDDVILLPYTTVKTRMSGHQFIPQILASAYTAQDIPAAENEVEAIMRESHRLIAGEDDDFTVRNQSQLADAQKNATRVMTLLLASIAGISLFVGGIGIMNMMLVSVTERTREIGIRMAIGARSSDVLTQFLVESVVMCLLGGALGVGLGFAASAVVARLSGWVTVINPQTVMVALLFSVGVGVFFGFYPARKAARLNPIEALRYE
jgi:putative ABC transport system permease protein